MAYGRLIDLLISNHAGDEINTIKNSIGRASKLTYGDSNSSCLEINWHISLYSSEPGQFVLRRQHPIMRLF